VIPSLDCVATKLCTGFFSNVYEHFFKTTSPQLKEQAQSIVDFLQMACGFDESQEEEDEDEEEEEE